MEVAGGGKQGLSFGASGEGTRGVSAGAFGASPARWNAPMLEPLSHQMLTLFFFWLLQPVTLSGETSGTLIWGVLG